MASGLSLSEIGSSGGRGCWEAFDGGAEGYSFEGAERAAVERTGVIGEYGGAVGEGGFVGLLLLGSEEDESWELSKVLIVRAGILDCFFSGHGADTEQIGFWLSSICPTKPICAGNKPSLRFGSIAT